MQYVGFIKTKDHLNIVMEYVGVVLSEDKSFWDGGGSHLSPPFRLVENGSLTSVMKRFGKLPEPLVAIYLAQILEGLSYLHDQGVIHRDIKGRSG